jgi:hypothetical protein
MTRTDADRADPALAVDKGAEPQAERLPSRSIPQPEALTPQAVTLSASPAEDAGPRCHACRANLDADYAKIFTICDDCFDRRATPSSSPAPGAPRSYAQVPLIDQLEASAASPPVGGAPAETDTIAPLSYAESVARGRAMERIAFPEADAPAEATQGLHIEALHAAASDLLHLAHGGECDPRTLREHAGALYAVAERIFQLAATVAETDQALRQMAEIAADACDARDHHRTARLAAEQRVEELEEQLKNANAGG